MNFGPASATSVWGAATRTLSGFGGALASGQFVNVSLAANSTANFNPTANRAAVFTFAAKADASGTVTIVFTDATNAWTAVTVAAGTTGGIDNTISVTTAFWQITNNSATVAAHYFGAGYTLIT